MDYSSFSFFYYSSSLEESQQKLVSSLQMKKREGPAYSMMQIKVSSLVSAGRTPTSVLSINLSQVSSEFFQDGCVFVYIFLDTKLKWKKPFREDNTDCRVWSFLCTLCLRKEKLKFDLKVQLEKNVYVSSCS